MTQTLTNARTANHRYTTEIRVRDQMIVRGWVPEGPGPNVVEMCSPV